MFQTGETNAPRETDPSVPSKEDIPTFDEWKKQVMEVEKEKSMWVYCTDTRQLVQGWLETRHMNN